MPTRNRVRKITGGPQGDDAVVVILIPTVGEMREQNKLAKSLGPESDEAEDAARKYLAAHVLDWNWMLDETTKLPNPHENPEVFAVLMQDELRFIGQALAGNAQQVAEEQKKLQMKS
jgi:hypothetical protein